MTSRFESDQQKEARAALLTEKTDAFKRWLAEKHPEVHFGIGFFNEVKDYMQDSFLTAGDEDFEYAIQHIDTRYVRQHVPTESETKEELIDKICGLIASNDGTGRDGKFSTFSLATERKKMAHWTIQQLTQRLEEVVRKQTLAAKPITELHQIVESGRKYQGYPTLGKSVVRPGTVRAVPLDSTYLRGLDAWELKKLCRLYGVEQVNNRLAGKD